MAIPVAPPRFAPTNLRQQPLILKAFVKMDSLAPAVQRFALSTAEKQYRLGLNHGLVSARQFWLLLQQFDSAEAIWNASAQALRAVLSASVADKLAKFCQTHDVSAFERSVQAADISVCFFESPSYPPALRTLYDPPFLLYYKGANLWSSLNKAVAVIGTRRPTPYGLRQTERITRYLVQQQCCVVSGMALGIDAAAHRAALQAGGPTVAVLGSGLGKPSPRTHLKLFSELCQTGMVISEFPPAFSAQTWTFPMRNRVVSGLSSAVVVIEAARKSGTLITVDCAIEQGREVFAMPGPVDSPQSEGTHNLIQEGAYLLAQPENLSQVMNWAVSAPAEEHSFISNGLTNTQQAVYEVLSESPQSIENIVNKSKQKLNLVLSILTELEIKGLVERLPGKLYRRSLVS
jgi:DNA processing protein